MMHTEFKAQQVADTTDDRTLGRMPLHMRAVAARMSGRSDEARQLYPDSIDLNDALGQDVMAAAEHRNLAYVEVHAGNVERAGELFAEAHRRLSHYEVDNLVPYLTFDEATVAARRCRRDRGASSPPTHRIARNLR